MFEVRYKTQLKNVSQKIQKLMETGLDFKTTIWNEHCQVDLVSAAIYYVNYYIVKNFYEVLKGKKLFRTGKSLTERPQEIQKLMGMLFRTFAIYQTVTNFESFY